MAERKKMNAGEKFAPKYFKSTHINSIPDPVLIDIFQRLEFIDRCRCAMVCERWHSLSKDFTLKKKIVVTRQLQSFQFSSLVQHHFTHHLEEFQLCLLSRRMMTVKKNTLYKICKRSDNMKKMVLMSCSLSSISLLSNLPSSLVHLSIRGSEIFPNLFFTKSLCTPPPLVCLDIGGVSNFLTSEDLYVLTNLRSLRALYLEGCFRVNNGGIEHIIGILPQLLVFDVEGTDISNEGAITILRHCVNATDLFFGHTAIDDGVLLGAEAYMVPRLTVFCVRNTNITEAMLEYFVGRHEETHGVEVNGQPRTIIGPHDYGRKFIEEFPNGKCQHYVHHKIYGLY